MKVCPSSFTQTNMKSRKVRAFFVLLAGLAVTYIVGFGFYILARMIGESYPKTWDGITALVNGMSFQFTLEKAGPMLNNSLAFLVVSIILVVAFWLLRWQVLRTSILATALLSLAYLACAFLLLIVQSSMAHAVILVLIGALFLVGFVVQSNMLLYLRDESYGDVFIESLIALGFLFFIVRMLVMALTGGKA